MSRVDDLTKELHVTSKLAQDASSQIGAITSEVTRLDNSISIVSQQVASNDMSATASIDALRNDLLAKMQSNQDALIAKLRDLKTKPSSARKNRDRRREHSRSDRSHSS